MEVKMRRDVVKQLYKNSFIQAACVTMMDGEGREGEGNRQEHTYK